MQVNQNYCLINNIILKAVADLGFVAWGGGTQNFKGAPRILIKGVPNLPI